MKTLIIEDDPVTALYVTEALQEQRSIALPIFIASAFRLSLVDNQPDLRVVVPFAAPK